MGFVLSDKIIGNLIESMSISHQGDVCIFAPNGSSISLPLGNANLITPEQLKEITQPQELELLGSKYIVCSYLSGSDFQLVNLVSDAEFYADVRQIQGVFTILIIALFVLIVLISLLFSGSISKPLVRLAKSFGSETSTATFGMSIENTSVYRNICSNISSIRNSNEALSSLMEVSKQPLRNATLLALLREHHLNSKFLSQQLDDFKARCRLPRYTLVLISFDYYKRAYVDYSPLELSRLQEGLCDLVATQKYPFEYSCEYVECMPQTYACIFNLDADNLATLTQELNTILTLADLENNQLRLIFVTSDLIDDLSDLPTLYRMAKNALRYRVLSRPNQLIDSLHLPTMKNTSAFLTDENKVYITNYITAGNSNAASSYICELIARSAAQDIPYDYLIASYFSILTLIAQILTERGVSFFELFSVDPFAELNSLSNLDEIENFFHSVCVKVAAVFLQRQQQESDILRRALDYIAENFQNRISLEDVSAYIGYSPKYFSRYFKEQTNVSFVRYLNQLRIQSAKDLLSDASIPIKDVATRVGFESANTFVRTFKQFEGVPPGQYRTVHLAPSDRNQAN